MVSFLKDRASTQARYSQQSYMGTISDKNIDSEGKTQTYNVELFGEDITLKKIPNATQISFSVGEGVTLNRINRNEWQIVGRAYIGT